MKDTKQALVAAERAARAGLGAIGATMHELKDEADYGRPPNVDAALDRLQVARAHGEQLIEAADAAIGFLQAEEG